MLRDTQMLKCEGGCPLGPSFSVVKLSAWPLQFEMQVDQDLQKCSENLVPTVSRYFI